MFCEHILKQGVECKKLSVVAHSEGQEHLARSLIWNCILITESVTLADKVLCLTDRVTIRSSTNAVLWSQMRILVINPFLPCTYSNISTACLVSWGPRTCKFGKETNFSRELSPSIYPEDSFFRNTSTYGVTSKNTIISHSHPWRPLTSHTAVTLNNLHLQEALTIFILTIIPDIGSLKWNKELREGR